MSSSASPDSEKHNPPHWGPPGGWKHRGQWGPSWRQGPPWRQGPRFLFIRFALIFGMIALFVLGGMAALAFMITRFVGGDGQTAMLVWIGGCSLSLALPIFAGWFAIRAFRGIAAPLSGVMTAAEAVAEGDLSVRVSEHSPGEFGRLARSFNRMIEELERIDQQRRNLTADVAHELRTPLHIIQGNLEGILDGVYEPDQEHIEATLEETQLLGRLVEDLRILSLAEAGQLSLVLTPLNVADFLVDMVTSFAGQAEAVGLSLRLVVDEHVAKRADALIMADAGRLDQVVSNLIVNAMRHTPAGGMITLEAQPSAEGVRLVVQDSGEGIAPEALPHIFDRFWRGDRARSHTGGGGGGLGLAIARQLVQAHGGRIEATSVVGQGTTFVIDLPRAGVT